MKKIYLLTLGTFLAVNLGNAKTFSPAQMSNRFQTRQQAQKTVSIPTLSNQIQLKPARSVENPQTNFVADEAEFKFYKDLYGNGNDAYWLFLSNAGIDQGNPTGEGQMARILIVGGPSTTSNPVVPAGTYSIGDNYGEAGSIGAASSSFMDIFYNPDDPEDQSLVGYIYSLESGELTISIESDEYVVKGTFEGVLYDGNGGELDRRTCQVEYSGSIDLMEDPGASYPALENDVELNIPNLSGRYEDGDYTLTFYGVELDPDGYIIGAGDLFNVELFTPEVAPMNTDDLVGTFTGCDLFVDGIVPGYYMYGIWYELISNWWIPMGTYLSVYDENLDISQVGLAADGTITVTKVGDEHKFVFDLVTVEGKKMTGSWQGKVADYVVDFSEPDSVDEISAQQNAIFGGKGYIQAPADAEIYTVDGVRTLAQNLMPGIYVVKSANIVKKVIVK